MQTPSLPATRAKFRTLISIVPIVVVMLFYSPILHADLAAGSQQVPSIAEQMVRIAPGSPFGNNDELIFQVSAQGFFNVSWDPEAGGTAMVNDFVASFSGTNALLGNFDLVGGNLATTQPASFGELFNITDDNGDLVTAEATINTGFNLTFAGGTIYTQDTATFEGNVSGSFANDVFISDAPINLYFSLGGDPANDPVIGQSFGRTVRAVPEPSTFGLLACCALFGFKRRR